MDQSSYMPVTPVLPGDMEGLRRVGADAKRVTHPLFVIVKCLFLMAVKKDQAGRDVRAQLDAVIGRSQPGTRNSSRLIIGTVKRNAA